MKRESRANLWFLAVFLAVSLPGAVILFRKKLDPEASRMDQPDAVADRMPYMAPPPVPPGVRWMVPPRTRAWLGDLTRERSGAPMLSAVGAGPEWEPVISDDHRLQAMSQTSTAGGSAISLLLWDGSLPSRAGDYSATLRSGAGPMTADVQAVDRVAVPPDVRKELVNLGYAHPPTHVLWLNLLSAQTFPGGAKMSLELVGAGSPPWRASVGWAAE